MLQYSKIEVMLFCCTFCGLSISLFQNLQSCVSGTGVCSLVMAALCHWVLLRVFSLSLRYHFMMMKDGIMYIQYSRSSENTVVQLWFARPNSETSLGNSVHIKKRACGFVIKGQVSQKVSELHITSPQGNWNLGANGQAIELSFKQKVIPIKFLEVFTRL